MPPCRSQTGEVNGANSGDDTYYRWDRFADASALRQIDRWSLQRKSPLTEHGSKPSGILRFVVKTQSRPANDP